MVKLYSLVAEAANQWPSSSVGSEYLTTNQRVEGSSPPWVTIAYGADIMFMISAFLLYSFTNAKMFRDWQAHWLSGTIKKQTNIPYEKLS